MILAVEPSSLLKHVHAELTTQSLDGLKGTFTGDHLVSPSRNPEIQQKQMMLQKKQSKTTTQLFAQRTPNKTLFSVVFPPDVSPESIRWNLENPALPSANSSPLPRTIDRPPVRVQDAGKSLKWDYMIVPISYMYIMHI